MGFEGTALELMESYLEDRTMQVQIGNARSDPVNITQGVPTRQHFGPYIIPQLHK